MKTASRWTSIKPSQSLGKSKVGTNQAVIVGTNQTVTNNWVHLPTTNPIESTFATVRLRQRVTKGPGSRATGIAMAFKLIESAQGRWRAVNAPHLVPLVRAGATFAKGKLVERDTETAREEEAA